MFPQPLLSLLVGLRVQAASKPQAGHSQEGAAQVSRCRTPTDSPLPGDPLCLRVLLPQPRGPLGLRKEAERKWRVDCLDFNLSRTLTLLSRMSFLSSARFLVQQSPPPDADSSRCHDTSNNFPPRK